MQGGRVVSCRVVYVNEWVVRCGAVAMEWGRRRQAVVYELEFRSFLFEGLSDKVGLETGSIWLQDNQKDRVIESLRDLNSIDKSNNHQDDGDDS